MAKSSEDFWHFDKKGVERVKKKMSKSQRKRRRKMWEEKNRKPPENTPKIININEPICKKKNLCLLAISGKARKSTGSRRTKHC